MKAHQLIMSHMVGSERALEELRIATQVEFLNSADAAVRKFLEETRPVFDRVGGRWSYESARKDFPYVRAASDRLTATIAEALMHAILDGAVQAYQHAAAAAVLLSEKVRSMSDAGGGTSTGLPTPVVGTPMPAVKPPRGDAP